jgi:hypothetical protein
MIAFATGLLLTSGALLALHAGDPHAGKAVELAVLVTANLVATMFRFVLYRAWVFAGPPAPPSGRPQGQAHPQSEQTVPGALPVLSSETTRR